MLREQGKYDEAQATIEEAIAIATPALRADHPRLAAYKLTLARLYLAHKDGARAEPLLRDTLAIRERVYPPDDWRIGDAKGVLGQSLVLLARYDEAEALLLDARRLLKDRPGLQGREARAIPQRLVALYEAWGRPDQAAIYRVGGSPDLLREQTSQDIRTARRRVWHHHLDRAGRLAPGDLGENREKAGDSDSNCGSNAAGCNHGMLMRCIQGRMARSSGRRSALHPIHRVAGRDDRLRRAEPVVDVALLHAVG